MDRLKKVFLIIVEILLVAGFIFAVMIYIFPDVFSKKKDKNDKAYDSSVVEVISTEGTTEETTEGTTEETIEGNDSSGDKNGLSSEDKDITTEELIEETYEDNDAPFFLSFDSSPVIEVGDNFDIDDHVGYADDVDRDVDIKIVGEFDNLVEGVYPLEIVISDDAGHSSSETMELNVVSSITEDENVYSGYQEEFSDFINDYKTDNSAVGIDISRWQGAVDFDAVKAAGCEFVYIRLGGYDDGELYTDRYYIGNIAGAKAAGLKEGVYWHAEEKNAEEIRNSVDYLVTVLGDDELNLPIAYDWEDFYDFERYDMNIHDINTNFKLFAKELENRGYEACLYGSKYYLESIWKYNDDQPVWLAHYTSETSYSGHFFMWQHGCTGRIDGIDGDVDLNILYKDKYEMK